MSQCCEPTKLLLARMGSTKGLLTIALPPDADRASNGSNGRTPDVIATNAEQVEGTGTLVTNTSAMQNGAWSCP